jgi:hypothetical protein
VFQSEIRAIEVVHSGGDQKVSDYEQNHNLQLFPLWLHTFQTGGGGWVSWSLRVVGPAAAQCILLRKE